jgi:hypothetical protein
MVIGAMPIVATAAAHRFHRDRTNPHARDIFVTSLWSLPCTCTLMLSVKEMRLDVSSLGTTTTQVPSGFHYCILAASCRRVLAKIHNEPAPCRRVLAKIHNQDANVPFFYFTKLTFATHTYSVMKASLQDCLRLCLKDVCAHPCSFHFTSKQSAPAELN